MENSIYRMSFTESCLVLIVISLWLFALINFIRKLERICNPPSIFLNYSIHNNINLNEHYQNKFIQPRTILSNHFNHAISVPTINASPRTTILMRSPSERFSNTSLTRCVVIKTDDRTTARFPSWKKKYQHKDTIDEDDCYQSKI